jgi:hypothetical protein
VQLSLRVLAALVVADKLDNKALRTGWCIIHGRRCITEAMTPILSRTEESMKSTRIWAFALCPLALLVSAAAPPAMAALPLLNPRLSDAAGNVSTTRDVQLTPNGDRAVFLVHIGGIQLPAPCPSRRRINRKRVSARQHDAVSCGKVMLDDDLTGTGRAERQGHALSPQEDRIVMRLLPLPPSAAQRRSGRRS